MKMSSERIFSLFAVFLFNSEASANFFFGNAVSNNGATSISKNVRFRYPPRPHFMGEQNIQLGQTLSKTKTNKFNEKQQNSRIKQRKNKKEKIKILMKSKGLLNNQRQKTIHKNVFGFKTSIKGLKFTPTDIKKYTGKLTTSRRQTFKWASNGPISDYLMPVPRL
ncbi:hypothetical protein ACQ4LE_007531 [Meloidogyne hapla]|uniref:Uncharacterized protein n=1 Tax=Meloidogyne hapla TaxID=6305 RepID=A0A1I8BVA0_MELHA